MQVPQEGRYVCKLNGQLVIYEANTGSLCGAVPCVMAAPSAHEGFTFKHTLVLVKADGTIQTKTTDTLKAVFGWDGVDPFWLMDNSEDNGPMRSVEFEIVGGPETGDKGGQYFKSQWLNPVGGGMKTPAAADRRSVLAKYGSKFAALAGVAAPPASEPTVRTSGTNLTSPPVRKLAAPAATVAPPPSGPPQGATMEEAWLALNEAHPGKPPEELEKLWFDTIARVFPNKSNTELKPQEWGKLKAEVAAPLAQPDEIPM